MKEKPPALNNNLSPLDLNSFPLPPRGGAVVGSWRLGVNPGHLFSPFLVRKTRGFFSGHAGHACFCKLWTAAELPWRLVGRKNNQENLAHQESEVRGPSLALCIHMICEQRFFISNEPQIWCTTEPWGIKLIGKYRQNLAIRLNEKENKRNHSPSKTSCNQCTFFLPVLK